ncbi:hypothetical protein BDW59DRAFT_149209 [Aspergillus cavernicola]|uniref:F-box domain-containing protein n=1 Tax=Aspergillus cavernicola TaxID=176166 RepID=A0ABR4I4V9_9EURO
MSLLTLPTELLCLLPNYLDNIESFTNAASSCRTLRSAFLATHPSTILHLAAASAPTFFSPHPYFLVAATAKSVSDWAIGNPDRTTLLRKAFYGGIYALYDFCLQHGGLTLDRIRQTHLARFTTINPLSDKIDKMAGKQWLETPNFWTGGVSEAVTLYTDADRAAFQIIIYGELFGTSMDAFLDPVRKELPVSRFDVATRLDYLTYSYEDQRVLRHILKCGRWRRMWAGAIRGFLDEEFTDETAVDEDWRKKMLRDALMMQGLEGMQLVTCKREDVSEGYLEKIRRIRGQIWALEEPPAVQMLGKKGNLRVSEAPDPAGELNVCFWQAWS